MGIKVLPGIRSAVLSYILITFFILSPWTLFAQETDTGDLTEQSDQIEKPVEVIEISEISSETEKLGQRIRRLKEILHPLAKAQEIDSLLNTAYHDIQVQRDSLYGRINELDARNLREELVEWEGHRSQLKDYQGVIDSRIKALNAVNDEVVVEIQRWQRTKESLTENTESTELFTNIDTIVVKLQEIVNTSLVRLDSVFTIQKQLTEVVMIADDVIAEINRAELELQKDYFVLDSPPIWNLGKIKALAIDPNLSNVESVDTGFASLISEDVSKLKNFFIRNGRTAIFQLLFILLVFTLLLVVKHKWKDGESELTNLLEKEARIVIHNPVASALTVGMLISSFFYAAVVPVFRDLMIFVVLLTTVYLLPKLSSIKIMAPAGILLFAFLLMTSTTYFDQHSFFGRLLLLFLAATVLVSLAWGRKVMNDHATHFPRISIFRRYIISGYLMITAVAIIANIIGMVNLSFFLIFAVLYSVGLGAVVYLSVKVFTSIIILIFKFRSNLNFSRISQLIEIIQKRVRPTLIFVGVIVWLFFTLRGFGVYEYLNGWMRSILEIHWRIGEMTISVGGILSFTLIFIITMFIAKIVANIFQDEWLIKVLPRGIAPAISLIIRILLIATGFYMGLSAAGFDLSKISLLLGALGVGIGFGLQSIVLNFISGLILAFERPINLGDAIEVDQEFGVVTSIGVRASNIKTYKGSEVIIPNGDLVSKKVVNWTLSNRDRRSKILMKTSADADPEKVIALFNRIAGEHPNVFKDPPPVTHFYGFNQEGNLDFALIYWTSFSDTLNTDSDIALRIFKTLKEEGIQAPIPRWKIESDIKKGGFSA